MRKIPEIADVVKGEKELKTRKPPERWLVFYISGNFCDIERTPKKDMAAIARLASL